MPSAGGNGGVKFATSRIRKNNDGVAPGFAAVPSRGGRRCTVVMNPKAAEEGATTAIVAGRRRTRD
jgi:hypothetical protein